MEIFFLKWKVEDWKIERGGGVVEEDDDYEDEREIILWCKDWRKIIWLVLVRKFVVGLWWL